MDIIKRAAKELKERVNKTSAIEKLLDEATSKENWQAHPKTLNTISDSTTNSEEWEIISKYIWERLYKSDKSATRTFKTLVLIEYLLKNGSPKCIMEFKDELYKIRKLQDYQFVEGGEDKGLNVRNRAKGVVELLTDKDKLDHERQNAKELRGKMTQVGGSHVGSYGGVGSSGPSSSSVNASKYAGYSNDSYKDSKYAAYSSKDLPNQSSYKPGESYDATEFKGLDKYRKKDEDAPAEKKITATTVADTKPSATTVTKEQPKLTVGQIKIQPPSATGVTNIPKPQPVAAPATVVQQPQQQPPKTIDLFEMDGPTTKPSDNNGEDDWGWTSAPPVQQPKPSQPLYTQQPVQQQQLYQQQPVQQQTLYSQPYVQQQQQQQLQQPINYYPQQQQQQQQPQYQFNNQPTFTAPQTQKQAVQEADFFSDFQTSKTATTEAKNYSKDEFDLIDLGGMKKEAEKKQKEKEQKNNANNNHDLGFSTLNAQLDSFSFSTPSFPTTAPAVSQQSNYAALNTIGAPAWGQQAPMGYGYPPQNQGYGAWPAQNQGYGMNGGQPQQQQQQLFPGYYGAGYNQNGNQTNFMM